MKNTPIFITSYNRLNCLKLLVERLESLGCTNIIIMDNNSTYQPLIDYLESIKHRVHRFQDNIGHLVLWKSGEFEDIIQNQNYVLTDPDVVPNENCPDDFLGMFNSLLNKYQDVTKVGFSLDLHDIPDCYPHKKLVLKNQKGFFKNKIKDKNFPMGLYDTLIDTTFAMYRAGYNPFKTGEEMDHRFLKAIRTGFPYSARHLTWYINPDQMEEDDEFYKTHSDKKIVNWNLSLDKEEMVTKYNSSIIKLIQQGNFYYAIKKIKASFPFNKGK